MGRSRGQFNNYIGHKECGRKLFSKMNKRDQSIAAGSVGYRGGMGAATFDPHAVGFSVTGTSAPARGSAGSSLGAMSGGISSIGRISSGMSASMGKNSATQGGMNANNMSNNKIARRSSQEEFSTKNQTALLVDWDDTLFPTTWIRMYMGLHWRLPLDEQKISVSDRIRIKKSLDDIQSDVEKLLTLAVQRGKVIIITLARHPWVMLSCENFFPRIGKLIREHNIKIVYAQQDSSPTPLSFDSEQAQALFWIDKKQNAITRELQLMYNQYEGQTWKNVISIGDSDFERRATIEACKAYAYNLQREPKSDMDSCWVGQVNGHPRKVRTKTIKMYDAPRVKDLSLEIQLLIKWLPALINLDKGLDCDFEDDAKLATVHRLLTGEILP